MVSRCLGTTEVMCENGRRKQFDRSNRPHTLFHPAESMESFSLSRVSCHIGKGKAGSEERGGGAHFSALALLPAILNVCVFLTVASS